MSALIARVLFSYSLLAYVWSLQLSAYGDMTEPNEIKPVVEALSNLSGKPIQDSSCRYLANNYKAQEESETLHSIVSAGLEKRLDHDSGYGSGCEVRKMNTENSEESSATTSRNRLSIDFCKKLVRVARPECPLSAPFSPGSTAIQTEFDSGNSMLESETESRSDTNSETELSELKDVPNKDPATIEAQLSKDEEIREDSCISGDLLEETREAMLKEDTLQKNQISHADISSKGSNSLEDIGFETPVSSRASLVGRKSIYGKLKCLFGSKKTKTNRVSHHEKDTTTHADSVVSLEPSEGFFLEIGHAGWTAVESSLVGAHPRGVDSYFYSKSEDGSTFSFGVFDASNSSDVNSKQESFSTGMRNAAEAALEDSREGKALTPLELTQIAYQKSVLDRNVPTGSTATLIGIVNGARNLHLSYTGTPWASLFRGKELLDQTRLRSDAESGEYHFVKTPLDVYQYGSIAEIRAKQTFATMEQDMWRLQKGDIVLVTTNGLYKRLSSSEIVERVEHCLEKGRGMRFLAKDLVKSAIEKDSKKTDDGEPKSASKNDVPEDIVVLVMRVV